MCPVTLTGLAITAGAISAAAAPAALATAATISSVMTVVGVGAALAGGIYAAVSAKDQQKKETREKIRRQEQQNKLAADALRRDYEQAGIKKVELQKQAASKKDEISLATKVEQAEVRNSAGEAGMAGLSIDNLLDSVTREGLYDSNTVSSNLAMNVAQIDRDSNRNALKYSGRIDDSKHFIADNTGQIIGALGGALKGAAG